MRILGLHTVWHDTGACLIDGGSIVAISEERLSRVKYDGAFPKLSIDYVLRARGLPGLDAIDLIVVDHLKDKSAKMEKEIRRLGYRGEIHFISHHDSHAAAVYYQSGFDDAAILVVDGTGSMASVGETGRAPHYLHAGLVEPYELHSYYRGSGDALRLIDRTVSGPDARGSIGMFYDAVSMYLNFGPFGAGKVMGLAPYGGRNPEFQKQVWREIDGRIIVDGRDKMIPKHFSKYTDKYFHGLPVRRDEPLPDDVYAELAYQAQYNCETALIRMANHLHDITRSENLCICGGVGLNSVSNHKIMENTPFKNIFIHPGCSDTGIPIGNALYGHHVLKKRPERFVLRNAYMGREYSEAEIESALQAGQAKSKSFTYKRHDNVARDAAQLLADGKILGWFQGGSEVGPRALGHRSILSDPRPADMRDVVNLRVKHREPWRPFAPSVLLEKYHDYFKLKCPSPYMLLIAEVVEDKREKIPAVTHVDGTARVQTVTKEDNGIYYDLISNFNDITGTPLVLNTSFNVAGEAIVETPADALACTLGTEIDHLVIGPFIVTKTS